MLVNIQLAIIILQIWCSKWQKSLNILKTYIIFYAKKKLPPSLDMQVTIDETPLTRVKGKRILGIVIDKQLSFTPHLELTTKKC